MLISGSEDYVRAGELIELALTEAGPDLQARAHALSAGAIFDMNIARQDRAEARAAEALDLFQQLGDARGVADILDARALAAYLQGRLREAADLADHVARLFLDSGELLRVGMVRGMRGLCLVGVGRGEEGLAEIDEVIELERALAHPDEAGALYGRCEALCALGRVEEAMESARAAIEIARRVGHREWLGDSLCGLGLARTIHGDLKGAEEALRQCLDLVGLPVSCKAWARLASVLIARGDLASAELYVDRALAQGPVIWQYEARIAQAELALARCDPEAPRVATETLDLLEAGGYLHSAAGVRLQHLVAAQNARSEFPGNPEPRSAEAE
jgi:tetratricopeptide (TPR) repeat protein